MLEIVGENAKKPSVRGAPKKREGSADLLLGQAVCWRRQPKHPGKGPLVIMQEEKVVQLSLGFIIEWVNPQLSQKHSTCNHQGREK